MKKKAKAEKSAFLGSPAGLRELVWDLKGLILDLRGLSFGLERIYYGPERADFGPERADLEPERSPGGGDIWTDGHLEIHPCVLQDIGSLGPLPKKHTFTFPSWMNLY